MNQGSVAQPDWKNWTFFLLTICVVILCSLISLPFLPALIGSITLAVVTYRPYLWLESKCKSPTLAASLGVSIVTLSIVTPAFFLVEELIRQALLGANLLRAGAPQQRLADLLNRHSSLALRLESVANQVNLRQASQSAASYFASYLAALLSNSLGALAQLVLMIVILFFLYRDHRSAKASVRMLLPLDESEKDYLLDLSAGTIHATALGRFVVAAVQGLLATLAYRVLGLENAVLWGVVTALVSIVPAVGASLVWFPIAAYLAITDHWVKAGLLAAWGGLVVSTIDNFLYPILIGSRLQQNTIVILLSALGGVGLFGVTGLILGPVILTIAKALLEIWSQRAKAADVRSSFEALQKQTAPSIFRPEL